MYPMEGVTSQPQAVTAGRPTHVKTGKLFNQATREDTSVYTPAAANVHNSMDHALAHSPVSSGSAQNGIVSAKAFAARVGKPSKRSLCRNTIMNRLDLLGSQYEVHEDGRTFQ